MYSNGFRILGSAKDYQEGSWYLPSPVVRIHKAWIIIKGHLALRWSFTDTSYSRQLLTTHYRMWPRPICN
jgi:hypothetical protein